MLKKLIIIVIAAAGFLLGVSSARAGSDVTTIESKDGSFSAEFPSEVSEIEFSHAGEPGTGYRYFAYSDGTSYYAFSYPGADAAGSGENLSPWYAETVKLTASVFEEYKAETIPAQFGTQRVEFSRIIERPGDPASSVHRIMNLTVGERILSFRVVGKLGDDPAAGERFFESVRIGAEKNALFPKGMEMRSLTGSVNKPTRVTGGGRGTGTGSGIGVGRGSGIGSGAGSVPATDDPIAVPTETRALKIISMEKPTYTVLGKYYRISGVVILRVAFGSDGKIGSVSPIKGLPFGLTERAVLAARQITFSPKIEKGKPVNSTKTIQFNFGI
ncbi:MAG: energy transducer TonB [Acidobacteria bacterium]|nr:energy transducer TonB [Acidobacteriota bacterium]